MKSVCFTIVGLLVALPCFSQRATAGGKLVVCSLTVFPYFSCTEEAAVYVLLHGPRYWLLYYNHNRACVTPPYVYIDLVDLV